MKTPYLSNLRSLSACLLLAAQPASSARAATMLFDFESDADLAAMHDEGSTRLGAGKSLERTERFASSGRFSLRFSTPRWKPGMPQWPSFECRPPVSDWSRYDRLALDITNLGDQAQTLSLFVSDTKTPTRQGLAHTARLAPFSHTTVTIPLAQFAEKKVNPSDIRVIHFFTSKPPGDMNLYLDRIQLLASGEAITGPPTPYLKDFAALQVKKVESLRAAIQAAKIRVQPLILSTPVLADWTERSFAELGRRIGAFEDTVARADAAVLDADREEISLDSQLSRLESLLAFRAGFETVRPQVQVGARPRTDFAVGFASSMEKILPRETPLLGSHTSDHLQLSLARNEKEGFQVLVLPCESALRRVRVRVGDLRSAGGEILPSRDIIAAPVGYVRTRSVPPYGSGCVGWWPDPILTFMPAADIAKGDLQSFWVRVHAAKEQAPGIYRGKLDVLVEDAPAFSFDLEVRVFAFTLPDRSPLPLAITFAPADHPMPDTENAQVQWRQSPDYPVNAWKKHKSAWVDFLADYYITYDSLYHRGMPDFEALAHLEKQGRLDMFNLGYYGPAGAAPADLQKWREDNLPRLRRAYARAKELGLLKHSYIYGCDESPAELFPQVQRAAEILKAEFPDVMIMTTTYDRSYGQQSVIKSMDAFCPLTPNFDPAKAEQARRAGKQVWWYICCGPHHPHLNSFIEYPAIEGRLLMGVMTAKYRPDGFLYYQISIWNSARPITSGPFTDWDPRSWTTYHGDGSWTCVGPDGTPLPTIRLENFRDGLEDYGYVRILDSLIAKVETSPELRKSKADWLRLAKSCREVPSELLKDKTEYTHDPALLYHYRNELAEAIERAGITAGP